MDVAAKRVGPGIGLLGLAVVTGLVLRLAPILLADFPLRDGGLFVTMAHDIRHAGFGLPEISSFNGGDVPFAYPPLGLYILALIPGDPITTERWLPLLWSMAAIPAAYLLSRELVDERRAGLTALIFAAMPITWAIEGAGVTRALAFSLLLFTLWRVAVLVKAPTVRNAALAGVLAAAAILTHPAVGLAGLALAALLFAFTASRRGLLTLAGAGVLAAILAAPWLARTLIEYGPDSVISALSSHQTESTFRRLLTFGPSWIGTLDFVLPLALLGTALALHRRDWLLPAWVLLMLLVPGGDGRFAALAWALLAASGAMFIAERVALDGALRIVAAVGFIWLFVASLDAGYRLFTAIPTAVQQQMVAAGRETPANSRFAVAVAADTGLEHAALDWFPTLSGRVSVGTFMGFEWTSSQRWQDAVDLNLRIQRGEIPREVDYVFMVEGTSATWAPAP
jgi:4-amino-4-deoxy-L-arabinose transferase-like glycosyltransferase